MRESDHNKWLLEQIEDPEYKINKEAEYEEVSNSQYIPASLRQENIISDSQVDRNKLQRANLLWDNSKKKVNLREGIGNYLELETYVNKLNQLSSKQSLKAILSLEEQSWKGDLLQ